MNKHAIAIKGFRIRVGTYVKLAFSIGSKHLRDRSTHLFSTLNCEQMEGREYVFIFVSPSSITVSSIVFNKNLFKKMSEWMNEWKTSTHQHGLSWDLFLLSALDAKCYLSHWLSPSLSPCGSSTRISFTYSESLLPWVVWLVLLWILHCYVPW